jgi:oligosaccharide repeat unit polymerase
VIIIAAFLLLLLATGNYFLHRDILYPAFLQASLWLFAVVLFFVTQSMFIPVPGAVFAVFVLGALLFSLGAFVASYSHQPVRTINRLDERSLPNQTVIVALGTAAMLGLVLYVQRAAGLASSGPSTNPYVNLRYALSVTWEETGGDFGVLSYFIPCAYVFAGITVLMRRGFVAPKIPRSVVALAIIVGVVYGVLSSGRSVLLPLIVIALTIPAVLRVTTPLKTARTLVVVVLVLFVIVGLALGKGGDFASTLHDNWVGMRDSFVLYTVGGIPSFGTLWQNPSPDLDMGVNTFRTPLAILRALGFGTPYVPLVQPYADIPMPMNVYTIYQPYIRDFGLAGPLFLFPLGFLHGFLYRQATIRTPRAIYVLLFSLSLFPLVMQIFQDMYFSVMSTWIQYAAISFVLFVVFNRQNTKNRLIRIGQVG